MTSWLIAMGSLGILMLIYLAQEWKDHEANKPEED